MILAVSRRERRWTETILAAFAGDRRVGLYAEPDEVDYLGTMAQVLRVSTPKVTWAMRLAVWLVQSAPLWCLGHWRGFTALDRDERAALLDRLLEHRWFAVRELTGLLKLAASIALLRVPEVRQRSGYDRSSAADAWSAPEFSETRPKHRLPTVMDDETPTHRRGGEVAAELGSTQLGSTQLGSTAQAAAVARPRRDGGDAP